MNWKGMETDLGNLSVNNEAINLVTLLHLEIACIYSFMTDITRIWQTLDLFQFHSDASDSQVQPNGKTCSGHRPDLRFGSRRPMRMISQSLVPTSCLQQQQKNTCVVNLVGWAEWPHVLPSFSLLSARPRTNLILFIKLGRKAEFCEGREGPLIAGYVGHGRVSYTGNLAIDMSLPFDIDFRHLFVFEGVPEAAIAWWTWGCCSNVALELYNVIFATVRDLLVRKDPETLPCMTHYATLPQAWGLCTSMIVRCPCPLPYILLFLGKREMKQSILKLRDCYTVQKYRKFRIPIKIYRKNYISDFCKDRL